MDLQSEVLAGAEGAADPGEMDPDLIGLEAEAGVDLFMVLVDPLGGNVEVDAPNAVGNGEPRLRPEKGLVLLPDLVETLDGYISGRVRLPVTARRRKTSSMPISRSRADALRGAPASGGGARP